MVIGDHGFAVRVQLVAPEIAVEVLLGHEPRPPRGQPARAVVQRADHIHPVGVVVGLHPRMARGGAVDGHRGVQRGDAAVHLAVAHHLPDPGVVLGDLDHRTTVGGHFNVDERGRHAGKLGAVLTAKPGEHHLFVGVFVVHTKQPAAAIVVQRDKAHVVIVIAELLELRRRGLVHHVEFGRVGGDRIAPPQQHIGVIAIGHMVGFVIAPCQFVKDIAAVSGGGTCLTRRDHCRGAEQCGCRRDPQHAAQDVAASVARVDHIADGALQIGVGGDVVEGFKGFGLVADFGIIEDLATCHGYSFIVSGSASGIAFGEVTRGCALCRRDVLQTCSAFMTVL